MTKKGVYRTLSFIFAFSMLFVTRNFTEGSIPMIYYYGIAYNLFYMTMSILFMIMSITPKD